MSCCDTNTKKSSCGCPPPADTRHDLRQQVMEGYTKIAEAGHLAKASKGGCCGAAWNATDLAAKLGYSVQEVQALPEGTNMGLSCGNPTAIAGLKEGQVVLDLGSGGGFDAFLAGPKVGFFGRVIGVDMTPAMISKARKNIAHYRRSTQLENVEFRLGEIEHLPVADHSVDVVISNCVINLSPDKPQVWREIGRVLRPGGTVAVSDMALLRPLPPAVVEKVTALVGCVAGAVLVEEYRTMIQQAGFNQIELKLKPEYVQTLANFADPLYQEIAANLPAGTTVGDFITSMDVLARKN